MSPVFGRPITVPAMVAFIRLRYHTVPPTTALIDCAVGSSADPTIKQNRVSSCHIDDVTCILRTLYPPVSTCDYTSLHAPVLLYFAKMGHARDISSTQWTGAAAIDRPSRIPNTRSQNVPHSLTAVRPRGDASGCWARGTETAREQRAWHACGNGFRGHYGSGASS